MTIWELWACTELAGRQLRPLTTNRQATEMPAEGVDTSFKGRLSAALHRRVKDLKIGQGMI